MTTAWGLVADVLVVPEIILLQLAARTSTCMTCDRYCNTANNNCTTSRHRGQSSAHLSTFSHQSQTVKTSPSVFGLLSSGDGEILVALAKVFLKRFLFGPIRLCLGFFTWTGEGSTGTIDAQRGVDRSHQHVRTTQGMPLLPKSY